MTEQKIESPIDLPAIEGVEWLNLVHQTPFSLLIKGRLNNQLAAIKMSTSSRYSGRILQEKGIVSLLSHPNIIEIIGSGETREGLCWMAYPWITGMRVQEEVVLMGAPMSHQRTCRAVLILHQIAGALSHMHSKGVLHLDMKSDNVLISHSSRISVIDFGSAQIVGENHWKRPFYGTPVYASPERLNGKPYDQKADIYSLGILASRLLTGRIPSSRGFSEPWVRDLIGDLLLYAPNDRPTAEALFTRFKLMLQTLS